MSKFADSRASLNYRRRHLKDLAQGVLSHGKPTGNALSYFYRENDIDLIKSKMVERYAMKLVRGVDPVSGATTVSWESASGAVQRINMHARNAIMSGQQEVIALSTYGIIVAQQATLFDGRYSRFSYAEPDVETEITAIRQESHADLSTVQWDAMACAVGSSALYISVSGNRLAEQAIPPDRLWVVHGEMIDTDEGPESVDTTDIDQAVVVVLKLDGVDQYCAWFGPSDVYPLGRCVRYKSKVWSNIPQPMDPSGLDYVVDNTWRKGAPISDMANPLSLQSVQMDTALPVYPIVVLSGNPMRNGLLMTSDSLFQNCLEMSVMASIIFGAAGRSARGIQSLTKGQSGTTAIPDNWSEGSVLLTQGLTLQQAGWSAVNSKDAGEVFDNFMRRLAEDNHVAEFALTKGSEIPSGVALQMMLEPTNSYRNKRVMGSRSSVAKRWQIEKALINSVTPESIPIDAVESWMPGEITAPVDRTSLVAEWTQRIDKGLGDLADAIRVLEGLDTREKAVNWLESHQEELADKPFLAGKPAAPAAPVSMFGGGLRGNLGAQV